MSVSHSSDGHTNDAVHSAHKSRLQSLEREVSNLSRIRDYQQLELNELKQHRNKWFNKAQELRNQLIAAGVTDQPRLILDEAVIDSKTRLKANSVALHNEIIESSIEPEITYLPPNVLQFTEDSPFYRKDLADHRDRVLALGKRLKRIIEKSKDFCVSLTKFSESAGSLAGELNNKWDEIESGLDINNNSSANDPVSLSNCMGKLGTMLYSMNDISNNLKLSVDAFLVQSLQEFRGKYINLAEESCDKMDKATDEFESAIIKKLARKPKSAENTSNSGSNANKLASLLGKSYKKREEEEEAERQQEINNLANTKRNFELLRFSHTNTLNEILTERRLELIETTCASFLAFITYFHEGKIQSNKLLSKLQVSTSFLSTNISCSAFHCALLYYCDRNSYC
jgi:hypothetical protein